MTRIFISYSRSDEIFVRRLASELDQMGENVWIDVDDIPAGVKWSGAIQEGLDTGEVMLVVISPQSMTSPNVEDEWQYFIDQKKQIIPILWQPAKIHFQLNRLQYIDFHNQPFEVAMKELTAQLKGEVKPRHTPAISQPTPRRSPFPIIAGFLGAIFLIAVVVIGVFLLTRPSAGVRNSEGLIKAMTERNFGDAKAFLCEDLRDLDKLQGDKLWGESTDIECIDIGDDEVRCPVTIDAEVATYIFKIDEDDLICRCSIQGEGNRTCLR